MSLLFLAPHLSAAVLSSPDECVYRGFVVMGNKGGAGDIIDELLAEREGFGRNATGGLGGSVYHVTSLADSGPGSLRAAAESSEPLWIVFNISGTIHLNSLLQVKSDKTFDGRGANVTITGHGFNIRGISNIIVTNLVFNTAGEANLDGIRIYNGAHDVWVNHCDFARWTDGCLDITEEATDVTVSWCNFYDHDKTMLIGASPDDTSDINIRVTLHHNFFNGTIQRHPRLRFGKVDAYNNYLYKWGSYGMATCMFGQLLVEANIFEAGADKYAVITSVGEDPESGYCKLVDNLLLNGAIAHENGPEKVFNRSTYYTATIETANSTLKEKIVAGAGAGAGNKITVTVAPFPWWIVGIVVAGIAAMAVYFLKVRKRA